MTAYELIRTIIPPKNHVVRFVVTDASEKFLGTFNYDSDEEGTFFITDVDMLDVESLLMSEVLDIEFLRIPDILETKTKVLCQIRTNFEYNGYSNSTDAR